LKYDPKFKKSILRRATANLELGNNQEAVKDLRKILLLEPKNSYVRSQMIRVSKSAQMSSRFSEAFIGHYLRRELTSSRFMQREEGNSLSASVLRISVSIYLVLSIYLYFLVCLRQLLAIFASIVQWFSLDGKAITTANSVDVAELVCAQANETWPEDCQCQYDYVQCNAKLNFFYSFAAHFTDSWFRMCSTFWKFVQLWVLSIFKLIIYNVLDSEVLYSHELAFFTPNVDPARIKDIQKSSQILTRLPYFSELIKLKDTSFPKLDTILAAGDLIIDKKFLKCKLNWLCLN
jgi:hypothetical protein